MIEGVVGGGAGFNFLSLRQEGTGSKGGWEVSQGLDGEAIQYFPAKLGLGPFILLDQLRIIKMPTGIVNQICTLTWIIKSCFQSTNLYSSHW